MNKIDSFLYRRFPRYGLRKFKMLCLYDRWKWRIKYKWKKFRNPSYCPLMLEKTIEAHEDWCRRQAMAASGTNPARNISNR